VRGALNLFQATMLRWRSRHPYNAAHAARVDAPFDEARLRSTVAATLEAAGLAGYVLDARRGRYEWRGGAAEVALDVVRSAPSVDESLRATIERTLEAAFPRDGGYCPFRFHAVVDVDAFWLVLAYDHLIAGGDSAAALLGAICAGYLGGPPPRRLERHPARFRRLVLRHPWQGAQAAALLPRLASRAKRARRAPGLEVRDGRNAFLTASLDAAAVARISAVAKRCAATRNDVLMAAVLRAVALSGLAWRVVRDDMRDSLFAKHYPVWAGVTSLSLPGLWDAMAPQAGRCPEGYRRGVSTGPLAPIVVAATFTGDSLELGVSFRPAVVAEPQARAALDRLVDSLLHLS